MTYSYTFYINIKYPTPRRLTIKCEKFEFFSDVNGTISYDTTGARRDFWRDPSRTVGSDPKTRVGFGDILVCWHRAASRLCVVRFLSTDGSALPVWIIQTRFLPFFFFFLCARTNNDGNVVFFFFMQIFIDDKPEEMFCPFSSGAPPRANVTQTEQQQPLNLKHLSEAVRTLTSPPVSTCLHNDRYVAALRYATQKAAGKTAVARKRSCVIIRVLL